MQQDPLANRINEAVVAFGSITNAYVLLKDVGTELMRYNLSLINTTNQDAKIQFESGDAGEDEITVPAGLSLDKKIMHFGKINIKYLGLVAPTDGSFYLQSW